ncbi:uncharacterized protein LOC135251784 isoform X2 [Anguilla rostrata]|uniref:uncharacterized protein LOC135251784 isoform X2 n=1 Tax=Anguilla rostrata TaxID=7938 RepID=UPI0030D037F1
MGPAQGTMGTVLWFTLLWTSGCGHSFAAQVLKRNIYFSCAQRERITLSVPSVTSGREFIWERTSHQHNNKTVKIAVIESSNEKLSWTHIDKFFKNGKDFEISMEPLFQNAGVFSFSQTRPENVLIARYEVFALKVEPPLWSSFSRGADVSASCTVSRLQDSATLHWEKEGPHTSNTTLSHKNSAHIIIHSADEHSEGRYSCSLEQNGLLLHNVSNTLSVRKDTYHTSYNLYRDSSETEVVFVCASPSHHRTARWAWVPFLEGKTKTLATVGKEGKVRISTEIDGERFSSDGYDGILFPLRISPVMFQDAGRYSCYVDNSYFSYITLITLQVSAEPPGGLSRNQSVVLNCQISQVIGSVTLAWLRMKGGRGELVKQEVLSEGHPEKMLSLTLPILSGDQLHWACAVFTESMLRAQVPLHLRPLSAQPGWSTETVVRVVIVVLATLGMLKVLMWYCRRRPAMLVQYKYCLSGEIQGVSLQAPAETNGTEFIWEWTSHDGSYTNTRIITIQPNGNHWWEFKKTFITKQGKYDIYLEPELEDGGTFTFIQTKPEKVSLAQVEVFAVKVEPSRWSKVKEGSDATMSCEVSHLPDSATLDWERDREPTANTTLIYNNTAHIIIHSADQYSEGTYNCTLRWNGALIFSIPKPLKVSKGTYGTEHTLYRGSLNSSEVVLICHSLVSYYGKAAWQWKPSVDKYENASISTEVDKERFSSDDFDGSNFPLRISPVKFGDSGRYFCYFDGYAMASVTLVTVQVLVQYKYFLSGEGQGVSLQAPAETNGTEFIWEWTSHDGSYANARIITIQSDGNYWWDLRKAPISKQGKYDIYLEPKLQNAGVFTFIQTKPEKVKVAQFEVFAAEVKPSLWSIVEEGSDVIMSCEVSHLPDSATLDWERDTEPTANTTLIYNNTAHVIIHSADRYSEGTYNCTLRWNGEFIFSIPRTLQVENGTFGTQHTLYRGSLSSSEVVLICHSLVSYRKAYWRWEPLSGTNTIRVASAEKYKNVSISMEIDKERFSSERYDGSNFPLRISPVKFGDSGMYFCYCEYYPAASVTLVTVEISAEPPSGLSRNQSVVLNCEISLAFGNVTLAWLRMKGGRGELVKQEVLSQGHPKKMLSLTLPILSRDQLHWACAVFTESMLRAQVPLRLILPAPITEPEEPKPGWSTETVVRVVIVVLATLGMLKVLMWYCRRRPAMLVQYKYFLSGEGEGVSLQAPAETNGTEFFWEWTSHDGSYANARIITIPSDGKVKWNLSITRQGKYDIVLQPKLQNAGVFTFIQTKPEKVKVSQFEVFAVKVEPSRWSSVKEGSDVIRSCEVSHLPDSATLDWERDREPTGNTTLIYNNTAHIIIHSADRSSEGTYNCTLRWNGALIFSIPRTLQVYKGTFGTHHILYRGSLSSSEVVLICRSQNSYGTAYWQWAPSSETNELIVASADNNTLISMEIDKERFSSEHYNGSDFPLRISPVKFGDSGRYFCYCDAHRKPMATVTLVTVQVLVQYKYFLSGEGQWVSLQAPAKTKGTEFIWEWTSHDGSYTNTRIITIQPNGKFSWNLPKATKSISKGRTYDIYLRPVLQNAGVYTFIQTKQEKVNMSQFEVFAVKVEPSHWSSVKEGSDVTMSCEVSHLPDSATLDWERDTDPTANTTLIYNNTAHIIIHSADRYSEGTYSCTLRWNGEFIFSIPRTLQVSKGTYGTEHTLYRGSLNSSEVVLICHSLDSYGTAYWQREPSSETNAIRVASGDKNENTSISMKIDKERFSSEHYDGSNFPLRISPVKFGDSGRYFCFCDAHRKPMATVTLVTVQVLVQYKYFLSGEGQGVSLQAPAETNGTEFIWEWTSHDGSYTNARIITIQSDGTFSWNLWKVSITRQGKYDIYLHPKLQNAGVFTFIQTKPEKVKVAQFEVFAAEVKPSRWSSVKEGSDVTMSCEVSHLPDSATLDWERDREPTANTTLIYNNTAHIIIHSADRYSEGTYNCTLRWNGALIFSIPRTLQVYKGTRGTQHTLYRGSLSSSEVVLICRAPASYRTAYWRWASGTNAIIVASADKYENALISMEIDNERFSLERYNGSNFPLRISPVKFGDSGMYFCHFDHWLMATVTLLTVQVSAVPPGGLSRNQSVMLNCEISQVIGSVTLAWLRMKGGRGELVKQEVLSEGHPKKMLSLTLPILSRDQLHWACAVFTESMLRAQVPLHLTLPTPITEPEEPKPGWSTETVIRVVIVVLATLGMLKVLMWYCRRRPAMLVQYKYFLSGEGQRVSLQAPTETNGTEFIWEWTSHDGSYTNARLITIQSDGKFSWNLSKLSITKPGKYDIVLQSKLQNAGVFTFIQTKPEKVNLSQFEVFAVKVEPSRWSRVNEGSDVIRSCEVSHLPDSATLDWERDTEPTANTTLIYNNTAHIIIHSADRSSQGTYSCTLRWNGELIFSIPKTLQVESGMLLWIPVCTREFTKAS